MIKLARNKYKFLILGFALALVLIDQLIKFVVVKNMQLSDTIPILQDILHITYVLNDGAAFSFMAGQAWLLCGVTSLIMIVLFFILFSKKVKHPLALWSLGLIIGGGIGNLIDRFFRGEELFFGKVVDYVDFRIINFAVFNFADCCVVIGTILISVYLLFFDDSSKKTTGDSNE